MERRTDENESEMKHKQKPVISPLKHSSLQRRLNLDTPRSAVAERPGPGNKPVKYIDHQSVCNIANDLFGYNGWSCYIDSKEFVFCEKNSRNRWDAACVVQAHIELNDGTRHSDAGWGESTNSKSRSDAMEHSLKTAVSDARKRCLRVFGRVLGGSLYESEEKKKKRKLSRIYSAEYHDEVKTEMSLSARNGLSGGRITPTKQSYSTLQLVSGRENIPDKLKPQLFHANGKHDKATNHMNASKPKAQSHSITKDMSESNYQNQRPNHRYEVKSASSKVETNVSITRKGHQIEQDTKTGWIKKETDTGPQNSTDLRFKNTIGTQSLTRADGHYVGKKLNDKPENSLTAPKPQYVKTIVVDDEDEAMQAALLEYEASEVYKNQTNSTSGSYGISS